MASVISYEDKIYGKIKITEPLIIEIIKTREFQRLKDIDLHGFGYGNQYCCYRKEIKITRFEHSIGTYWLLEIFSAKNNLDGLISIYDKLMALLHDLFHTVFSHGGDYRNGNRETEKKQNTHDLIFEELLKKSKIAALLENSGIDIDFLLKVENLKLTKNGEVDVSADRIDYFLRTAVSFEEINRYDILYFLNNLGVCGKLWVFNNFNSAKKFAELFEKINRQYYILFDVAVMLKNIGNYLKHALAKGYLSEEELYLLTDTEAIYKINGHLRTDRKLDDIWQRINNGMGRCLRLKFREEGCESVFIKSRTVDPLFIMDGKINRLSNFDSLRREIIEIEKKPKEYFFKFKA